MDDRERSLVDQALDLLVYAPLGLALEARDLLPRLAERGRGQVALARLAGRFAAAEGRQRAGRLVDDLVGGGDTPAGGGDDPASAGSAVAEPAAGGPPPADESPDTAADELPIEGYDELSAPQILPRLDSLTVDELDVVLAHETSHRARATIINRIHQLRS